MQRKNGGHLSCFFGGPRKEKWVFQGDPRCNAWVGCQQQNQGAGPDPDSNGRWTWKERCRFCLEHASSLVVAWSVRTDLSQSMKAKLDKELHFCQSLRRDLQAAKNPAVATWWVEASGSLDGCPHCFFHGCHNWQMHQSERAHQNLGAVWGVGATKMASRLRRESKPWSNSLPQPLNPSEECPASRPSGKCPEGFDLIFRLES